MTNPTLDPKIEKRFDEEFPRVVAISDSPGSYAILWSEREHKKLKSFLVKELEKQKKEIREEMKKLGLAVDDLEKCKDCAKILDKYNQKEDGIIFIENIYA